MSGGHEDYDYIIRLIQYLEDRHRIRFFITSRDFDVLYRWWEKGIPAALARDAIDCVVERGRRRGSPPARFAAFGYEVRKRHKAFLALDVGRPRPEPEDTHAALDAFLAALPPKLEFLRGDFGRLFTALRQGGVADPLPLEEKLLQCFRDDEELNAKTDWFLKNLVPELRRPEVARRYRVNCLWGRFGIPSLE